MNNAALQKLQQCKYPGGILLPFFPVPMVCSNFVICLTIKNLVYPK